MTRFFAALAAVVLVLAAGNLHARELKQVYLRDGSILEAQSARRAGSTVVVIVNRDVVLEFPADQVDLPKTFAVKPAKAKKGKHHRHGKPAKVSKPLPKGPSVPAGAVKPATAPATAAGKPVSGVPGAPPAKPVQGKPSSAARGNIPVASSAQPPKSAAPPPAAVAPVQKPAVQPPPPPAPKPVPVAPEPPPAAAKFAAVMASSFALTFVVILIALVVILIASLWKVFAKAGRPGWASVIPVYNLFVLVQISGKPWWWFLLLFVPLIGIVIMILLFMDLAKRFDKHPLFGVGLCFLGFIFFPILAFDGSTYQ
jgi:hypothetical protein